MLDGPFAFALAAGMAATVNPCGFALLPAYLAAFIGDDDSRGMGSVPRAFAVSAAVTLGFVAVFGLFGLIITPLAVSVEKYLPWATIVIGLGLVALGISLARGRELNTHIPKLNKGGKDGTLPSMFLYGVSYAVASLSCTIGPFLAVTTTTFRSSNYISGVAVFVAYALGMGVIVTALTVAVALAKAGIVSHMRRAMPYVSRGSGVLLVIAGAYVAWYGWFEVRTLNGGDGSDPIVERALEIQTWLQNNLIPDDAVQALVVLLVAFVVIGGGVWVLRRRPGGARSGGDRATESGTQPSAPTESSASANASNPPVKS